MEDDLHQSKKSKIELDESKVKVTRLNSKYKSEKKEKHRSRIRRPSSDSSDLSDSAVDTIGPTLRGKISKTTHMRNNSHNIIINKNQVNVFNLRPGYETNMNISNFQNSRKANASKDDRENFVDLVDKLKKEKKQIRDSIDNIVMKMPKKSSFLFPDLTKSLYKAKETEIVDITTRNWYRVRLIIIMLIFLKTLQNKIKRYGSKARKYEKIKIIEWEGTFKEGDEDILKVVKKEKKSTPWYIIGVQTPFSKIWSYIIFLCLFYVFTIMPFRIAFTDTYQMYSDSLFWLDMSIELCFLADIIITFLTPYYDGPTLVVSLPKIAWRYIKSFFFIDTVAIFPFYVFEWNNDQTIGYSDNIDILRLLRLPRLYRLLKIVRILKLIKHIKVLSENSSFSKTVLMIIKICTMFLSFFYICHLFACYWFFLAKLSGFNPQTWVYRNELQNNSSYELYLTALYFSFVSFLTVGYGDVTPYSNEEIMSVIFWMLFSGFYYSFSISNIANSFLEINSDSLTANNKVSAAITVCRAAKFKSELERSIKTSILSKIEKQDNEADYEAFKVILNELPIKVRTEITENIFEKQYKKILMFQTASTKFIISIVPLLKQICYKANEFIYNTDDPSDRSS